MSFDARYIPADEAPLNAQGEIILPDELAEIAVQLSEDSAYLTSCYPSSLKLTRTASATTAMQPSRSYIAWPMALIAGLLFMTVGWGVIYRHSYSQNSSAPLQPTPGINTSSVVAVLPDEIGLSEPYQFENASPALSSYYILFEFSGAELEGLYDLMEPPQAEVEF